MKDFLLSFFFLKEETEIMSGKNTGPQNRERIFEIASKMISVIKLLSIGVCLYAGISGNLGTAPMWPVWILIAGIFITLIRGIRGIYKTDKETGMDEDDKS